MKWVAVSAWAHGRGGTRGNVVSHGHTCMRTCMLHVLAAGCMLLVITKGHGSQVEVDANAASAIRLAARAHEHGEGVQKDSARAVQLYCDAARMGDAEAQFSLGWMYANARGVPRDDALAAYFFRLAAQQNHEHAQKMLRFVGEAHLDTPECLKEKQTQIATSPVVPEQTAVVEPPVPEFVPVTDGQRKALELVNRLAPDYGINPRLALAVIRAESNFQPLARSEKNAQGLMQLIPETAARFNVAKPFDPVQNVRGGLAYLRWLLAYFQGNVTLVAAAYNAGEGAVNRYRGIPPYAETRAYVKRIISFFGRNEHPYDTSVTAQSPALAQIRAAVPF